MFSTKLGYYPRLIKRISNGNHLSLSPIYTLRNKQEERCICGIKNNINYNLAVKSLATSFMQYTTGPIEIPSAVPPPPESDVFGELGGLKYEKVELDEEELQEEERLKNIGGQVPRKFKPALGDYAKMIKNYVEKGDLKSAQEVLEECKRNRDKPSPYMYTLLIRSFAIQGDIKTCFQYFSDMKTRQYEIKANTYTSLFNACANSPDPNKAVNYLQRVRDYMAKQGHPMNHAHYNVLVKAYGRHNKLEEANKLIKEMLDKKLKLGISTINSLMYACNSNTESGLKHVLHVWQLMRRQKIPPDIFSYNLILRAIRDTHFGNCTVHDLLLPYKECPAIVTENNRPDLLLYPPVISSLPLPNIHRKTPVVSGLLNPPSESSETDLSDSSELEVTKPESSDTISEQLPASIANLNLDAILKQNKLILFGGVEGILQKMKNDRIEPNVKTITYLMELSPDSVAAEEIIIKYAKTHKIPLDIDFFNMLIKKRSLRGAKKEAKAVLEEIHKADLKPNIITYGVLALSCNSANESKELLQTMKFTGHTINKYVADTLLNAAFLRLDFQFILELMEKMKREKIRLDESTFEKLDQFQQKMSNYIKTKHRYAEKERFKLGFSKFNMRYKSWKEDMGRKIVTEREENKK